MSDEAQKGIYCCVPPTPGLRMLTFPDGSQAGVMGLSEILAALYAEGRQVSAETAEEIVQRLTATNYIAPSARQRYCDLLIEEYGKYVRSRTGDGPDGCAPPEKGGDASRGKGGLSRLLKVFDRLHPR
jgi:hypothetical protein